MLAQANAFRTKLGVQVSSDLEAYFREFPNEREYIKESFKPGSYAITRARDEFSTYGWLCQCRSRIELNKMVVECTFPHKSSLDRSFKLQLTEDGAVGLSDMPIADLSKYLLAPVLFSRLIAGDPPGPSESD
jgi:hypothetical protein